MINYRFATETDNQQLIELTAATGMDGKIALRIDRVPDFFNLLNMRGASKVFVAVDNNVIIGSLCVSLQHVYIGGDIYPLHYIADFKMLESYRNRGIGMQLCNELANDLIQLGADLVFLNISKGNKKPLSFFTNRPNVPDFETIGEFNIYQYIGRKNKTIETHFKIEPSSASDELIKFLNSHYRKYELGSVITKVMLEGTQIYKITQGDEIVAAICLSDTMSAKQNVVTRLSYTIKYGLKFINFFSPIFGMSKMPALNEPVRMMYIKYFAVANQEKTMVLALINFARNIVYINSYSFLSIGLHEKDPLNKRVSGLFRLTFNSVGMILSIKNNKALIEKVKNGIPFEDYSIV